MKNRYLVKAKKVDNNKWVAGYLSFIYVNGKNENGFIYTDKACIYSTEDVRSYDVYTETICQCTGKKINNEMLFENDIVEDHIGFGFIEYVEKYCAFRVNYYYSTRAKWFYDYLDSEYKSIERLGNIHD